MKQWRGLLLGVIVSIGTLYLSLRGNDFSKIGDELARANWWVLIPTAVLFALGLIFRGYRWRVLLDDKIPTNRAISITNIGYFLGVLLPFRLGEVARSFLTTRLSPPISMFTSISSIVVERLIDLLSVVVMIALAVSLTPVPPAVSATAITSGVIAIAGLLVLTVLSARRNLAHQLVGLVIRILPFLKRLNPTVLLDRVLDGLTPLTSPRRIGELLIWNLLSWVASIAAGWVLLYMFFDKPPLFASLIVISSASLAVAIPAVPGNVGPFELAIIGGLTISGLASVNVPQEYARAFAYAIVLHVFNLGSYIIGGLIGLNAEKISFGELVRAARQLARREATESAT